MAKRIAMVFTVVTVILSIQTLDARPQRGQRFLQHLRFGVQMAENNLYHAEMLLRMQDRISLSAEQVESIQKMQLAHQEFMIKARSDIQVNELNFNNYMKTEEVKRSKVEKMIRNISAMKTDLHVAHINYLLDLRDLLTKEQLQKVEEVRMEFRRQLRHKRDGFREFRGRRGIGR
jgi:hypothetical protein